jgi:type IV pilus assembly protein PilN
MARINLLPWRENLRKKRTREYGKTLLAVALVTAATCVGVRFAINEMIEYQQRRNAVLEQEIAEVDKKIKEISELEKVKAQLIARMNVIQALQGSRPQIVHLFDELVGTIPEGVHLTKLVQSGSNLIMDGRAQSNARVSAYMRNIDSSDWIGKPVLQVISNKEQQSTTLSQFSLKAKQIEKTKEMQQ